MSRTPQNYGSMSTPPDVHFEGSETTQFNDLCENISTNIYTINASWKMLDNALRCIGTSRDNRGLRDKIHVTQLSTNQIISITPHDFNKLKTIARRSKKSQLQLTKLAESFSEAVSRYHDMQNRVASKMKANILAAIESSAGGTSTDPNVQAQMQMHQEIAFEQDMLVDRDARIRQIESDVIDVNQIMRELSVLVQDQGETIDSIENGIDRATSYVEDGASELAKAAAYQRSSRRKLCYLVLFALIAFIVLVIILVETLKK